MSSSDEEWMRPPTLRQRGGGGGGGGGGGADPLLDARRRALQSQRAPPPPAGESSGAAAGPSLKEHAALEKPSRDHKNPIHRVDVTEEEIESLRVELEAKKKELASLREKETMMQDHWRAQKAQRIAENAQLDGKLREQKDAIEDAKAAADRELRELEDEQQRQLQEERQQMEREVAEEYEPQIEAQRVLLEELQKEELKIQGELNMEGAANDIVGKCMSSAVSTILQEVQSMFDENASNSEEWVQEVEKLVRNEVRSSFSTTCDSEAQREHEEQEGLFNELLDFWRKVEEEERDYTLKIDEQLLLDFNTMVNEDLDRMQNEEIAMEGMYIQAQETWASHYQEMLDREMKASTARQTAELEEQQTLRHQLHLERMKALEEQHQDTMEKQQWFHEKELKLIREQYAKEEEIEEERDRVNAESQANITRATEESKGLLTALEELFDGLKKYRANVDEDRAALEVDRQQALDSHVETLTVIKDMVSKQTLSISEEQNSLSAAMSKLEILSRTVEQHLEDERVWIEKQEANFLKTKTEWDRECDRWQRTLDEQKCEEEERFTQVLKELHEAASIITEESRAAAAERDSVTTAFRIVSEQAAGEVEQLRQREEELNKRHEEISRLLSEFDEKEKQAGDQWQQLQQEREDLEVESAAVREDDMKLREYSQHVHLKTQHQNFCTYPTSSRDNAHAMGDRLQAPKDRSQNFEREARTRTAPKRISPSKHKQPGRRVPTASNNPDRLPLRVLHELKEMLGKKENKHSRVVTDPRPVSHALGKVDTSLPHPHERHYRSASVDPAHERRGGNEPLQERGFMHFNRREPARGASPLYHDSSSNNFTHLLTITDSESFNQSLHMGNSSESK